MGSCGATFFRGSVFDYSRNTGPEAHGLDFFKSKGLNNLEAELELYEILTRDMQQGL